MWGATTGKDGFDEHSPSFQSTRPVWGATFANSISRRTPSISIHAPRVGRDKYAKCAVKYKDISIHAPRVGRDYIMGNLNGIGIKFQSTRPVWGATY